MATTTAAVAISAKDDMYGQIHPDETPELIQSSLKELDIELNKLPPSETKAWKQAQSKCAPNLIDDKFKLLFLRCEVFNVDLAAARLAAYWNKRIEIFGPDKAFLPLTLEGALQDDETEAQSKCAPNLIDDKFKLLFLRCEVFNVDLAAARLASYWNKRIEIFGPDKAFLPLTLEGALRDDEVALSMGFARIVVGSKDPDGRGLLYVDPANQDKTQYTRTSMLRALWYVLHAALEVEGTQQMGLVFIANPSKTKFSQFDRTQVKMNVESIQGCIPIRVAAFQICHPPTFFAIVFPVMKLFLGERMRKRIKVHSGSEEAVLKKLAKFGLSKNILPTDLGGQISLDNEGWLEDRRQDGL